MPTWVTFFLASRVPEAFSSNCRYHTFCWNLNLFSSSYYSDHQKQGLIGRNSSILLNFESGRAAGRVFLARQDRPSFFDGLTFRWPGWVRRGQEQSSRPLLAASRSMFQTIAVSSYSVRTSRRSEKSARSTKLGQPRMASPSKASRGLSARLLQPLLLREVAKSFENEFGFVEKLNMLLNVSARLRFCGWTSSLHPWAHMRISLPLQGEVPLQVVSGNFRGLSRMIN